MYEISLSSHFDSGHWLRGYEGKCARHHGHRFVYNITLCSSELDKLGMVVDFVDVKKAMKEIEEHLDHYMLNEREPFDKVNPTAENIAKYIYYEFLKTFGKKIKLVEVWESPDAGAKYYE